jgi:hypothetical protein
MTVETQKLCGREKCSACVFCENISDLTWMCLSLRQLFWEDDVKEKPEIRKVIDECEDFHDTKTNVLFQAVEPLRERHYLDCGAKFGLTRDQFLKELQDFVGKWDCDCCELVPSVMDCRFGKGGCFFIKFDENVSHQKRGKWVLQEGKKPSQDNDKEYCQICDMEITKADYDNDNVKVPIGESLQKNPDYKKSVHVDCETPEDNEG